MGFKMRFKDAEEEENVYADKYEQRFDLTLSSSVQCACLFVMDLHVLQAVLSHSSHQTDGTNQRQSFYVEENIRHH